MYERILDKDQKPTFEQMLEYCGDSGVVWMDIEEFLKNNYNLNREIRFPYGNNYGWGVNYKHGSKHICDIHAESNAFTVFFQIRSESIEVIKNLLSDYALKLWDNKYPCGDGGWIRYRVTKKEQFNEIVLLLTAKVKPKKIF